MPDLAALDTLKPVEARAIIESLRRGSVPVEQVPYFTVGHGLEFCPWSGQFAPVALLAACRIKRC
jgi:hypothetical protein